MYQTLLLNTDVPKMPFMMTDTHIWQQGQACLCLQWDVRCWKADAFSGPSILSTNHCTWSYFCCCLFPYKLMPFFTPQPSRKESQTQHRACSESQPPQSDGKQTQPSHPHFHSKPTNIWSKEVPHKITVTQGIFVLSVNYTTVWNSNKMLTIRISEIYFRLW